MFVSLVKNSLFIHPWLLFFWFGFFKNSKNFEIFVFLSFSNTSNFVIYKANFSKFSTNNSWFFSNSKQLLQTKQPNKKKRYENSLKFLTFSYSRFSFYLIFKQNFERFHYFHPRFLLVSFKKTYSVEIVINHCFLDIQKSTLFYKQPYNFFL